MVCFIVICCTMFIYGSDLSIQFKFSDYKYVYSVFWLRNLILYYCKNVLIECQILTFPGISFIKFHLLFISGHCYFEKSANSYNNFNSIFYFDFHSILKIHSRPTYKNS
jgi:hypothetical protein